MAPLRILSINLLVDRADPDDLRRVITDAEPDVVTLQELGERSAEVVRDLLPHGHLEPLGDFFGMGIATRHPAVVERLDLETRSGWVARLEPGDWPQLRQPLDVLNVHLVNPIDRPWRTSRAARRSQIEQIATFLDGRQSAHMIIGDMNASPAWPEYKLLTQLGTDAAAATGTAKRTWALKTWGPRLLRIDHAFVSGVEPITTTVTPVKGSDHSALIVDLDV
ncbi:MAG: endonuclease/exonuclease/phosphatase family protein [Actinomycetia bacterium]|nr:endonuclease/exonuclease/phosphatase family protein [Actinomycetes bacterium]